VPHSLPPLRYQYDALEGSECAFGSGWAWLVRDDDGLAVTSSANQSRRADYLEAWWNVIDWDRVAQRYATAIRQEEAA
jgi:superoxide dismutase